MRRSPSTVRPPNGLVSALKVSVAAGLLAIIVIVFSMPRRAAQAGVARPATRAPGDSTAMLSHTPARAAHFSSTFDVTTFQRGSLHAHSSRSDGDSAPRALYSWYRSHGYQFAVVTDHNVFTDPALYGDLQREDFLLLGGEEVSMRAGGRQVHVNALCTESRIGGGSFPSADVALRESVERIRDLGGVAIVNHPNYDWAVSQAALRAAGQAPLLEIYSGNPAVHTNGDARHPSHEVMWDEALSSGFDFMGVAVDDAHHLRAGTEGLSQPGRGWVYAFASTLSKKEVCEALANGRMYSSTGATLNRIAVGSDTYALWPSERLTTVQFVGNEGRVLSEALTTSPGEEVVYRATGSERYVRARLVAPEGGLAWTPAVRVGIE